MQLVTEEVKGFLGNSSMIRRMFEAGIELKKRYGEDKVYDFSLGNPDLPPPPQIKEAMTELAAESDRPFAFGYMPNAGEPAARQALAELVSREQGIAVPWRNIVVTVGAAGGINALFRAVLERGDEVICPSPYFVEYGFYVGNFGGRLKPVATKPDFALDTDAIAAAITPATRAVILNSPNNPTGKIYTRAELTAVTDLLRAARAKTGRMIYLIADEPYRFLNFDGAEIPSMLDLYDGAVVIGSFSKSLSLPGERIGYAAVSPKLENADELLGALTLTNRILGFVNAPCIGQRLMKAALGTSADASEYILRRKLMADVLTDAGLTFTMPAGTFYFFPQAPNAMNDVEFVNMLADERILVVPGSGFGYPGYFRIALCVDTKYIELSRAGFKRAVARALNKN